MKLFILFTLILLCTDLFCQTYIDERDLIAIYDQKPDEIDSLIINNFHLNYPLFSKKYLTCTKIDFISFTLENDILHANDYLNKDDKLLKEICKCGDLKLLNLIREKGFDLNTKLRSSQNLLMIAARYSKKNFFKELLKYGIKVNELDKYNRNALYYASFNEDYKITKLLIKHKINVKQRDQNGNTVLTDYITNNKIRLKNNFVKLFSEEELNVFDKYMIWNAATKNDIKLFKLLNNHFPFDVNAVDEDEETGTLMTWISMFCSWEIEFLNYLIKKGLDINILDKDGQNTLFKCYQDISKLDFLMKNGIDYRVKDFDGNNILQHLIRKISDPTNYTIGISIGENLSYLLDKEKLGLIFNAIDYFSKPELKLIDTLGNHPAKIIWQEAIKNKNQHLINYILKENVISKDILGTNN